MSDDEITAAIDAKVAESNFAADADEPLRFRTPAYESFEHDEHERAALVAAAKELESAAEDYSAAYQKVSAIGMQEVYDFLCARAARLREQGDE